jgi:hypothetical protein
VTQVYGGRETCFQKGSAFYKLYLSHHIVPEWGDWPDRRDRARGMRGPGRGVVEGQVHEERQEDDAGNKSKSPQHHVRVFTYALRHKSMTTNPVAEVRQSAKRERVPSRLTAEELGSLVTQLDLMYSVDDPAAGSNRHASRRDSRARMARR